MHDDRLASATHAGTGTHHSPFFPSVWSFASSPQQPQPRKFPMLLTVKAGVTHFLIHGPCTAHCHSARCRSVVLTRAHQQTHTLATATAIHIPGFTAFLISLGKPDVKSGFARLAGCRLFLFVCFVFLPTCN